MKSVVASTSCGHRWVPRLAAAHHRVDDGQQLPRPGRQRPLCLFAGTAQLTIYRHPERIPELAGERGRPAQEKASQLGSARTDPPEPKPKPQRADTKLWAAFVLSGVGR
jgi:hypothetical protein